MLRIVTHDGMAVSEAPAMVEIFDGARLIAKITVTIKPEQGGDGGSYPTAKFSVEKND